MRLPRLLRSATPELPAEEAIVVAVPAPPEMQGRICALQISGLGDRLGPDDYDYGEEAAEALRMAIASDSWPVVFVAPGDVEIRWVVEA